MKLVLSFFILLFLILGTIFFKVKIFIKRVNFKLLEKKIEKSEYEINFGLYFFSFIKIFSFKLENGYLEILFFKKNLNEISNSNIFSKKIKPKIKSLSPKELINSIRKINFRLESLNLSLDLSADSVIITSMLVGIISWIISSFMQSYIEKFNNEKYKWKIIPNFEEKLFFEFKADLKISYSPILEKIVK